MRRIGSTCHLTSGLLFLLLHLFRPSSGRPLSAREDAEQALRSHSTLPAWHPRRSKARTSRASDLASESSRVIEELQQRLEDLEQRVQQAELVQRERVPRWSPRYAQRDRGDPDGCSPWEEAPAALKSAVRAEYRRVAEAAVRRLGNFTHVDLERALGLSGVAHLRIRGNQPSLARPLAPSPSSWTVDELLKLLRQAGEACSLPDVDLAFNTQDEPRVFRGALGDPRLRSTFGEDFKGWTWNTTALSLPVFSAANAPGLGFVDLLLPAPTFNGWRGHYHERTRRCMPLRPSATCFWRGSTTGFHQAPEDFDRGWRYGLVERVRNVSGFDVRFSGWAYPADWHQSPAGLREEARFGAFVPKAESLTEHPCHVDIDGNSYSQRFKDLLVEGAGILKVETPWQEFFYSQFRPDEHFVQVKRDLSNIEKQRERLLRHSEDLQYRAKYQTAVALHPGMVYGYICEILHRYAEVLGEGPNEGAALADGLDS